MSVRTRFAPSPTGYMHIGGMRTAFFCWLWARHTGGTFILRIDDTDRQRNIDEALAPILRAFRWLGLTWDEGPEVGGPHGPYFQSQRTELYRAAAERLLAEEKAFRDYDTPEQVQADREAAQHENRTYVNVRRSLELTESDRQRLDAEGRPHMVRFLVPRDRKIAIDDAVRGHVEWDGALLPDPVILRSDGSALYNFATVVDDAGMKITHVIRAEEHLSNTPVQVLLHEALENEPPLFAHIPFITAPGSTKKLSKRDVDKMRNSPQLKKMFERADEVLPKIGLGTSATLNPVMVEYYERMGYLPEAMLNALSRLGWSLDETTEIMDLGTIIRSFTLDRVVKSPAGFDADKLLSFQAHWMGQRPLEEKVDGCLPYLEQWSAKSGQWSVNEATREYVRRLVEALGDRLKLFSDILEYDEFFLPDDQLHYDEKAFEKRIRGEPGAAERLERFRDRLSVAEPFTAATLEALMHEFVESEGIKLGQIIHAVRVAVTGKATGIGMFECLELLGRERSVSRIDRTLARI